MSDIARTRSEAPRITYGIAPDGHRLPAETRLGPVSLQVADLERSLDYYERILGLRPVDAGSGSATLAAHGDERGLIVLRERTRAAPLRPHTRLGVYHFAILLPTRGDLGRFLQHLNHTGVHAGASDHHVSEALYLHDPDGVGIEVYADRPRYAWETNGQEIRMETAPLDTYDVMLEAGDSSWSGMPAGTTIGHVHLHVGTLDTAAAFYHRALGLDLTVWGYPGALFLSAGGYHHHLGLNTWAAGAIPAGDGEAKLLEWTLELPHAGSVAAAAESLETSGYSIEWAADGGILTRDPWGTTLRVVRGDFTTALN